VETQSAKKDAIFIWIDTILNPEGSTIHIPLIWEGENGPRPVYPYLKLNITSDVHLGQPYKSLVNETTECLTIIGQGEISLSIQAFYEGADEYLNALKQANELESIEELLESLGIAIRSFGTITAMSEIFQEDAEKRWSMDVTIGYQWSTTDKVGYINDVNYSGSYT
jgi:hypothetical protein